jgi:hypothetical protein
MKRDTRRASGESSEPGDDVKLGCSFFEKVGCTPEVRRISRRRRLLTGAIFEATSTPAACSRRSMTVRVGAIGAARRGPSRLHDPNPDASGGSNRRFEQLGEALRAPSSAPLNPVRPADALGGRVRRALRSVSSPRRRERRRAVPDSPTGSARDSETPGGLSQPTAQMVLTRVALAATSEPLGARP